MRIVELEEAKTTKGLRLAIAGNVPSPWSQGAISLFDMKGLDCVAVRYRRGSEDVARWTGAHNVPVALFDDEPPRTGWAEILALAERLGGAVSLVPTDADARVRMFGLANEILGEGGLSWNVRLLLIHAALTTEGRRGWPLPVAQYLAPKYGYAADRVVGARARAIDVLELLGTTLVSRRAAGHAYFLGAAPTALDVYAAVALATIAPLPPEQCPMLPPVRHAVETLDDEVRSAVPAALLEHRKLMFERHLVLPVRY
jgi:hypothetical protein